MFRTTSAEAVPTSPFATISPRPTPTPVAEPAKSAGSLGITILISIGITGFEGVASDGAVRVEASGDDGDVCGTRGDISHHAGTGVNVGNKALITGNPNL